MRISDWSADVGSSDLPVIVADIVTFPTVLGDGRRMLRPDHDGAMAARHRVVVREGAHRRDDAVEDAFRIVGDVVRSEEHTSELQSLMRLSYAVFCLKKKKQKTT